MSLEPHSASLEGLGVSSSQPRALWGFISDEGEGASPGRRPQVPKRLQVFKQKAQMCISTLGGPSQANPVCSENSPGRAGAGGARRVPLARRMRSPPGKLRPEPQRSCRGRGPPAAHVCSGAGVQVSGGQVSCGEPVFSLPTPSPYLEQNLFFLVALRMQR